MSYENNFTAVARYMQSKSVETRQDMRLVEDAFDQANCYQLRQEHINAIISLADRLHNFLELNRNNEACVQINKCCLPTPEQLSRQGSVVEREESVLNRIAAMALAVPCGVPRNPPRVEKRP